MALHLSRSTRSFPALPYRSIAEVVLGSHYELSLIFIGTQRAKTLNQKYRGKTYIPNVLTFPLSTQAGEIYLCPQIATKEATHYGVSPDRYIARLFIHGLLHLKGYPHGATMERAEKRYLKRFGFLG